MIYRNSILVAMTLLILGGCSTGKKCRQIVEKKCSSCHSIKKSCKQVDKSKQYWETTVNQMIRLNASITDSEKKTIIKCLSNSKNLDKLCEK